MDDVFNYGNFLNKVDWLLTWDQPVDIQGVDARILTWEQAITLSELKLRKRIKMAWDNPRENINWEQIARWIPAHKIMVYVLIGYWSTEKEDLMRVMKLKELGISPFVMPYDKHEEYQKCFARWVNMKAIFRNVPWDLYYKNKFSKTGIMNETQETEA